MRQQIQDYILRLLSDLVQADTELVLLAVILVSAVIVLDSLTMTARKKRAASGLDIRSAAVGLDGSVAFPTREYFSESQGLAGKPDAIIIENGFLIPVERKPLARKLRDRYVAQLLIYMRLIEEFEGQKPPYGYLILGARCRRVKVENSPSRQAWVQSLMNEMRGILAGAEAQATPHPNKCRKCDVRDACRYRFDIAAASGAPGKTQELLKILN